MTHLNENEESLPTGRMGELVVAKRYGKKYLRRAPVRTKDSWTPAQVLHRQRFSRAIAAQSYITNFVKKANHS